MRDLIVYALFRVFSLVCRALGARGAAGLGYFLGLALGVLDGRRARVLRHMGNAFGPARARSLIGRYYEHMGLLTVESARLAGLRAGHVEAWMEPEGLGRLRSIAARGKGVIMASGHVGNWEVRGQALAAYGVPPHVYVRPPRNPRIARYLDRLRASSGMRVHRKGAGMLWVMRAMRAGEVYGLMMDQDGSSLGLFVPFFGKLASTVTTAAKVARRTGAAIVPVTSFRLPCRTRHRLRVGPEIVPADTGDEKRDILLTTRRCNRALEEAILEHPAQWLWAHRRWRTRPGPEDVAAWERAAGGKDR